MIPSWYYSVSTKSLKGCLSSSNTASFFKGMSSVIISSRGKNSCHQPATGEFSNYFIDLPLLALVARQTYHRFLIVQKSMRAWVFLLAGVWTLTTTALAVEDNSAWLSRAWQLDDGLPGDSVTGVLQTPDGYLWVATEGGLARFDGVHFQNITVP
ncbi:MAG: two-component regulator propeller domain-containing protein, partial [Verrucomicrobiota bacterium]